MINCSGKDGENDGDGYGDYGIDEKSSILIIVILIIIVFVIV